MALKLDKDQLMALSGPLGQIMQTPQNQLDLMRRLQDKLGALPDDPNQINERALETATSDQVLRGSLLLGLGGLEPAQQAVAFLVRLENGLQHADGGGRVFLVDRADAGRLGQADLVAALALTNFLLSCL